MIILEDDIMAFLDDKEVFLAHYKDIKGQIGELIGAWTGRKVTDSDILIFESLYRMDANPQFIYDEAHGYKGKYIEVRYICKVMLFCEDSRYQPIISDKSHDVQLQEIRKKCEERGFAVPCKNLQTINCLERDGIKTHYMIAVISYLESLGDDAPK